VRYSVATNIRCYSVTGLTDYCPPNVYRAEPSHLFHNNGNGTFTDITAKAGLSAEYGATLGIATADFNGDGWIDIHVSNDSTPNQLWINQKNGTFMNTALLAGTAVSPEGEAKASMGVDAGDFDNDGDEDLFVGELLGQGADMYVNDGMATFSDDSARTALRRTPSRTPSPSTSCSNDATRAAAPASTFRASMGCRADSSSPALPPLPPSPRSTRVPLVCLPPAASPRALMTAAHRCSSSARALPASLPGIGSDRPECRCASLKPRTASADGCFRCATSSPTARSASSAAS